MYVLILTLFGISASAGPHVEHISGFTSNEACLVAGNAWLKQVRESAHGGVARAQCVKL